MKKLAKKRLVLFFFLAALLIPTLAAEAEIPAAAKGEQCFLQNNTGVLFSCDNPPSNAVGRNCYVCAASNVSNGTCTNPFASTIFTCEASGTNSGGNNPGSNPNWGGVYTPLTPIKQLADNPGACNPATGEGCEINVSNYIPKVFKFGIAIAGGIAVIMVMIGGIEYITADTIGGKKDGREKVQNAVIGLLLAIGAYLIVYTINPKALELNLSQLVEKLPPPASGPVSPEDPLAPVVGADWPSDASIRSQLEQMGITINKENCANVGQQNCTSVSGLSASIISGLQTLKDSCLLYVNCSIEITGGTEWWLHGNGTDINSTQHRPGGNAVDLSKNSSGLNNLIMGGQQVSNPPSCRATGQAYMLNGAIYIDEVSSSSFTGPHWHVCY